MNSKAFLVFLIVTVLVSIGIVLFYAKRHPNPRFRPKRGEVFLLSLFMGFLSAGVSFFMSQLFEHDWEFHKGGDKYDELVSPGGSGSEEESNSKRSGESDKDSKGSSGGDSAPPFMKE